MPLFSYKTPLTKLVLASSTLGLLVLLNACGGDDDLIVAKAVNEGIPSVLWTNGVASGGIASTGEGIQLENDGSLYLTSTYTGSPGVEGLPQVSLGLNNAFLIKYNSSGTEEVIMDLGWQLFDGLSYIETDNSGTVYIAGVDLRNSNPFYMAIDPSGPTQLLSKTITSSSNSYNTSGGLAIGTDGSLVTGGNFKGTFAFENGDTYFGVILSSPALVQYDTQGEVEWTYYPTSGTKNYMSGLDKNANGNVYCSFCSSGTLNLFKLNAAGEEQWSLTDLGDCQGSTGLKVTNNGVYAASNGKLRLLDGDGNISWEAEVGLVNSWIIALDANADGEVVITGNYFAASKMGNVDIPAPANGYGYFLAKFNKDGSVQWVSTEHPATDISISESGQVAYAYSSDNGVAVTVFSE